jgi:hypothetical protein
MRPHTGADGRAALGHFRRALAAERSDGATFDEAWAWARKSRGLPVEALEATRGVWRRAYVGEPPEPGELAAALLLDAFDDGHAERPPGPGRMVA